VNEINPIIRRKNAAIPSIKISKSKRPCILKKVRCMLSEEKIVRDKIIVKKDAKADGM
jgi:hypothetical protein